MPDNKDIEKETDSFETKLQNAKKTLETLMNPDITLEDSVKAYESGMKELSEAQQMLQDAQIKINEIKGS
jgi:exodeoxyribonuclease VII small subunit